MKKSLLFIFLINIISVVNAQTWSKKLHWQHNYPYLHSDSATGVKDATVMPDGNYAILAQVDQDEKNQLMVLDPVTGEILWKRYLGQWGGLATQYVNAILATSDTGIVLCGNNYSSSFSLTSGSITRLSSIGDTLWRVPFYAQQFQNRSAMDIVEASSGNYLALIGDTVYELNPSTGATVNFFPTLKNSKKIFLVSGSTDYIVSADTTVSRFNNTGNLIWNFSHPTYYFQCAAVTDYAFYTLKLDSLVIVDIATGGLINVLPFPSGEYSTINPSPSGDLYVSKGAHVHTFGYSGPPSTGAILKLDSIGNILWTKNVPITNFGLSWVNEMPGGKLFCSGAALYRKTDPVGPPMAIIDYMPFCFTTDLNGNGIMDSTTYLWPGDANQNHFIQFADDALYIQQSFGRTGYVRDTINYHTMYNGLEFNDFMADWSTTNTAGVNDKFCDVSGDGLIDTTDLNAFTNNYSFGVPVTYRTSSLPDVSFVPLNSVVHIGDTARFYAIAGLTTPLDSVTGIAFSHFEGYLIFPYLSTQFLSNTLGIPGSDTRTFSDPPNYCSANCAISRIDRSNHYLANDTLCIISFLIPSNTTDTVFSTTIVAIKAIRGDGTDVPVEAVNGSVTIDHSTGVIELNEDDFILYPNPSNDKITIDKSYAGKRAEIFNSLGIKVMDVLIPESGIVDVHELAVGNYYLKVASIKSATLRFIKQQ